MPLPRIIGFFIFYKFNDSVGTIWGLFGDYVGTNKKKTKKLVLKYDYFLILDIKKANNQAHLQD